ncbi:hypothetical protein Tco_1108122 [Tanacetum coccineum]
MEVAVVDQTIDEDTGMDVVVAKGVDLAENKGKGVEVNFAYQDEKIDNFDIDSFGIDSLDVDPKDQNDTTHLDVSDFLTNDLSIKQILAMSNLVKLEFLVLDISGQNYLSWVLDAEIYLAANGLGDTIQAGKETIESTPTGYCAHISEANVVAHNQNGGRGRGSDRRRGRRHGCGHGRVWIWLSLDVDPKDQNDTTHLDVSDFLTNDLSIKQIVRMSIKLRIKRLRMDDVHVLLLFRLFSYKVFLMSMDFIYN